MNYDITQLYIIAVPIGNLKDISYRAIETLEKVDFIACEDTRHSSKLLNHYNISKKKISLHTFNEGKIIEKISPYFFKKQTVALITDAGMPIISDPGNLLLQFCIKNNIKYSVLPGACAVITALAGSGYGDHPFVFNGFLPKKINRKKEILTRSLSLKNTSSIFFESPRRLVKTLEIISDYDESRQICIARELTKIFEEFCHDIALNLINKFKETSVRGEITLLISPKNLKW